MKKNDLVIIKKLDLLPLFNFNIKNLFIIESISYNSDGTKKVAYLKNYPMPIYLSRLKKIKPNRLLKILYEI